MNLQTFHFLRPEWLLALTVLAPVLAFAWRRRDATGWERICEPQLLRHLVAGGGARRVGLALTAFALGWVGACLALAGPTWERLPQLAFTDPSRTVFVLGLAPSMDARDVAPSRMARARHKLQDALDRLGSGSAALVVYREEGFAATPLTDDLDVLRELAPLLETNLAPGTRVRPARGIEEAVALLEPVGLTGADIVLVTDGSDDDPDATRAAAAAAARRGARVSVLGVAGASADLEELARAGEGSFAALSADDRDLARIQSGRELPFGTSLKKSEHAADSWRDVGAWLVWVPLLLAPLAFRKGWATAALVLLCLQLPAGAARAGVLDWFERPDQRGARAFAEEQYEASAAAFDDPAWRAAAQYRAGDFESSAAELANRPDPESSYNRGNALARAGQLEEALAAYDASLAARPDDPDTGFNRDLVQALLEEQQPPPPDDTASSGDPEDGEDGEQGEDGGSPPDSPSSANSSEGSPGGSSEESSPDDGEAADEAGSDPGGAAEGEPPPEDPGDGSAGSANADAGAEDGTADTSGSPDEMAGAAPPQPATSGADPGAMSPEQQEAERWMGRLPDDPGGLLREKIRRGYVRKRLARQQGDQPWQ